MNKHIKEKLIAALESNEYEFGRGALRTTTTCFCGMGVLCDLYQKENQQISYWVSHEDANLAYDVYVMDVELGKFIKESDILPYQVREWAEITEDQETELMQINDDSSNKYVAVIELLKTL
jgi:hypothetical protein